MTMTSLSRHQRRRDPAAPLRRTAPLLDDESHDVNDHHHQPYRTFMTMTMTTPAFASNCSQSLLSSCVVVPSNSLLCRPSLRDGTFCRRLRVPSRLLLSQSRSGEESRTMTLRMKSSSDNDTNTSNIRNSSSSSGTSGSNSSSKPKPNKKPNKPSLTSATTTTTTTTTTTGTPRGDMVENESETLLNSGGMDSEMPMYHSTLITAMRDYFGDDGREIQEYTQRPRSKTDTSQPLFRLLIIGGRKDHILARALSRAEVSRAIYYVDPYVSDDEAPDEYVIVVPDEENVSDEDLRQMNEWGQENDARYVRKRELKESDVNKWAQLGQVQYIMDSNVVTVNTAARFAKWACVDAVFVGNGVDEGTPRVVMNDIQQRLAKSGITLFENDVAKAIADGLLDVKECLASLISEDDSDTTESLIE